MDFGTEVISIKTLSMKSFLFFLILSSIPLALKCQNNFNMNPIVEAWQRTTVSIGNLKSKKINGKNTQFFNVLGSGMIAYVKPKGEVIPVLVTAKHVVKTPDKRFLDTIRIRFSWEDEQSIYSHLGYRIPISADKLINYYELPDTTIDLVCIPIFLVDSVPKWESGFITTYSKFASDADHFEGRDVYTLGYPSGLGVDYLTRGLLRKGIISWLPNKDIENRKFLIDCNVFPGNSGGPVFSFPNLGTLAYDTTLMSEKFFGIVIQRRFNYNEIFVKDGTGHFKSGDFAPESMGVGVVEPAKNVLRLLNHTERIMSLE